MHDRQTKVELEPLNVFNSAPFLNYTFHAYQYLLYQLHGASAVMGVGAMVEGRPVGLVLGEVAGEKSSVLSICVDKAYRNRGIGSQLLGAIKDRLAERGAPLVRFTYVTGKPATPAVEGLLAKCRWPAPAPKHLVCTSDKRMYSAPWMAQYKLPSNFEIFAWTDVTPDDRETLERTQREDGWVPEGLWPFDYAAEMEPANSIGVRYNGELVGWVITQPRHPDAVCYSCSWMRPQLQRRGRLVGAYAEAVRRQIEYTDKPIGIWIVPYKHESMAAFVLRRMKPWLISLAEFRESKNILTHGTSETLAAAAATEGSYI